MRLKRSFCGGDKADGYGQDNDGAQKEDVVESHRHRHRLDGDVCAADEKCRENNPKEPMAVFLFLASRRYKNIP